jgi:nucleolar GTP-binding protein
MNILYDNDHLKLALSQLKVAQSKIEQISKDYIKLLKFGDTVYRCKRLKRAALQSMCEVVKKQTSQLTYLEQVRKHLSKLPSIDPAARTLLLAGFPNVGKSSFMNKVTNADVDVQPYAFTTKSLFVGQMAHDDVSWQVIDTPALLDRPVEERNALELQAIAALAHLNCIVLFFVDVSGEMYSLEHQASLFKSIHPLFSKNQIIIIASKVDARNLASLSSEEKLLLDQICIAEPRNLPLVSLSNYTGEGIDALKSIVNELLIQAACGKAVIGESNYQDYEFQPGEEPDEVYQVENPASEEESKSNFSQMHEIIDHEWKEDLSQEDVDLSTKLELLEIEEAAIVAEILNKKAKVSSELETTQQSGTNFTIND